MIKRNALLRLHRKINLALSVAGSPSRRRHLKSKSIGFTAALAICLISSPGCLYVEATGHFGPYLDRDAVQGIEVGVSTKADVIAKLGPPEEYIRSEVVDSLNDDNTRLSRGIAVGNRAYNAFTYQYETLEAAGTWLLLFVYIDGEVTSDLLVIFFDENDVVREISFRKQDHS